LRRFSSEKKEGLSFMALSRQAACRGGPV
jgi:hypothetical protein